MRVSFQHQYTFSVSPFYPYPWIRAEYCSSCFYNRYNNLWVHELQQSRFSAYGSKTQLRLSHNAPSIVRPSSDNPSVAHRRVVRLSIIYISDFSSRSPYWIFMTFRTDKEIMTLYKCWCFSARSAHWRIKDRANYVTEGHPLQLGIIYNIGDILHIGRSSLNRENYYALFVSHSGNCLLNPDPSYYSTLGHDMGRYSTVES